MVFDVVGDVGVLHLHRLCSHEVALHLSVKSVAHQFEHDVGVAVDAWTLALLGQFLEDFIYVGHIEVTAKAEVLRLPVVAAQEWVHILDTTLSGGTVAQVSHVEFACERQFFLGKLSISKLLGSQVLEVGVCLAEDFGHGILALRTLTKHILMSRLSAQFDTSHTSTLLSTVVLLLHHQIEFVECVHPSTVLLLVILQWLEQSDHCHATLMFQWFHTLYYPLSYLVKSEYSYPRDTPPKKGKRQETTIPFIILFYSNRLGQVSWLVNILTLTYSYMVSQQLQRNSSQ